MLKSKLQDLLQKEYTNGFSDGREMMERDIIEAAKNGTPIDIGGNLFVVINVWYNIQKK